MKERKVLNAKNGEPRCFRLDPATEQKLFHVQDFFDRASNVKLSHSTILRRAMDLYVHSLDGAIQDTWTQEEPEMLSFELRAMTRASEGDSFYLEPVSKTAKFPTYASREGRAKGRLFVDASAFDGLKIPMDTERTIN